MDGFCLHLLAEISKRSDRRTRQSRAPMPDAPKRLRSIPKMPHLGQDSSRRTVGEHVDYAAHACCSCQKAKHQRNSDRQLTIGYEERDWFGVGKHNALQDGHHKRIGPPLVQSGCDPILKTAARRELGAKDFISAKKSGRGFDCDAKPRKRLVT